MGNNIKRSITLIAKPTLPSGSRASGGQSGFTFVEVLIAVFVLAVGLLTIAAVFAQGVSILVNTPTQLAAKEWANEIIDEIAVSRDAGLPTPTYDFKDIENGSRLLADVRITPSGTDDIRVDVTITYPINRRSHTYSTAVIIHAIEDLSD